MATSVGRINLDLGINSSGFKQELNGITKTAKNSVGSMSGMFGKLGGVVAAAFSVAAVANFAKACINLGSDLAEVQNVVDVTFGSMSSSVNKWAKDAMEAYGLSEKVAKEYMGQFGAMSKAFGNTEQMAYDQAAALTGLAGDVASFYNMTTDEAFTKLKAVYTGETESLKSLGVVMTQTALDEYALQQGIGKTTDAMSEQEKVALRLSFVQDRLAGASGDFARTSGGWANQVRVLSLRFDALKASIGQGLISALTPVIRVLNELVAYLQVAADAFANFMEAMFGSSGSSSTNASPISAMGSSGDAFASNMGDAATSAKAIKKSLAGFDQINILSSNSSGDSGGGSSGGDIGSSGISTPSAEEPNKAVAAAGKLKEFLAELKTQLIEIANITGLTGLWDDFLVSVGNVKTGVSNLFDSLKTAIANCQPKLKTLKSSFTNTFLTILQTCTGILGDMWIAISNGFATFTAENQGQITTAFTNVISIVTQYCTIISNAIGELYASIRTWWEADGLRIYNEIITVFQDIGAWVLTLWNTWVAPVLEHAGQALSTLWDQHLKPLWDNFLALITSLWDAIKTWWDVYLKPLVDWIIGFFGPPIVAAVNGIVDGFMNAVGAISDIISGLITTLRGLLDFFTGVFRGDWDKAWGGLKTAAKGLWDSVKGWANGAFNGIKIGFGTIVNIGAGAWSGLKSGAQTAWSGIKSVFSGVGTFFKTTFTNAWTAVKRVFSTGGKIFDGIKDGIVTAFKAIVNGLIDGINKVVAIPFNGINDALNGIKSIEILGKKPFDFLPTISVPEIPHLASGGYVAANTPQLAVIGDNRHEGEIVAPESKIAEAVARGFAAVMAKLNQPTNNTSKQPIYLTIKLGEDDFWQGFVDYHNSVVKRTGDSPLLI